MDDEPGVVEPVVDRWAEKQLFSQRSASAPKLDLAIFRLSGGVMRPASHIEKDDIEGLLSHVMALPTSGVYTQNIDRNLDYLFTSLQLDVISSIADRCSAPARPRSEGMDDADFEK